MERNSQPGNFLLHMVQKFPGMCNPTGSAICVDSTQAWAEASSSLLTQRQILFYHKYIQTKGKILFGLPVFWTTHMYKGQLMSNVSFPGNELKLPTPERWTGEFSGSLRTHTSDPLCKIE